MKKDLVETLTEKMLGELYILGYRNVRITKKDWKKGKFPFGDEAQIDLESYKESLNSTLSAKHTRKMIEKYLDFQEMIRNRGRAVGMKHKVFYDFINDEYNFFSYMVDPENEDTKSTESDYKDLLEKWGYTEEISEIEMKGIFDQTVDLLALRMRVMDEVGNCKNKLLYALQYGTHKVIKKYLTEYREKSGIKIEFKA